MREATGGRLHGSHRGSLGLPHLHRAQLPRHLGQVAQEVPDRAVSSSLVSRWLIAAFVDVDLASQAHKPLSPCCLLSDLSLFIPL